MISEVLPGVDRIENENIHKVIVTTSEALTGDSVPSLKKLYKSEFDSESYQNGTSTRMEAVYDRACIKSTMDCIEENVSLPAQQRTSQDGVYKDIILHKKLEEIECATYQNFAMDEPLLRGSELEATSFQPSSHDVRAREQKVYDLMLQSHESTLNNEKLVQQSPTKSQTVTVPISKQDGKYQTCRLNHALDLIISLDKQENFLDPVDDLVAPNYSKVIDVPMCFKTMRGKVQSQQYSNWQSFVDDFERICYNAMKYNQVRSTIWRAARKLLHQGKCLLEKFERRDAKVADSTKQLADTCSLDQFSNKFGTDNLKNLNRGKEGLTSSCALMSQCSQTSMPPGQVTCTNSLELKVMGEIAREEEDALIDDDCFAPAEALSNLVQAACPNHHNHLTNEGVRTIKSRLFPNINVVEAEINDNASFDNVQLDSNSQATETSSSFGCSLDKGENDHVLIKLWDSPEVQSNLRNDSEGIVNPSQVEASVYEIKQRKKNALNLEWKAYRRGIEWRCHWLELRIKALQDQVSRYNLFLEGREAEKPWRTKQGWHIPSAARTISFSEKHTKQPVLHRKRRRKVEDTSEATSFMSRHPLFSRYEKKRHGLDDFHEGRVDKQDFDLIEHPLMHLEDAIQPEESDMDEALPLMKGAVFGEDSNEELLWNIELLQIRVVQLRDQLNRSVLLNFNEAHLKNSCQSLEAKNVSPVIRSQFPSSPKSIMRPSRHRLDSGPFLVGQKASGLAAPRRRAADYDISNIVMSTSVIAKYVEPVRHTKIQTPRWKRLDKCFSPAHWNEDSSSNEGTDDELYKKMHDRMVAKERLHQVPHPLKRSIPEAGSSPIHTVLQARGKVISMDPVELERKCEDHDYLSVGNKLGHCEFFPKGKRTRRDLRCNFTHSRGRKLSNLFADTSIHGFNADVDIKMHER